MVLLLLFWQYFIHRFTWHFGLEFSFYTYTYCRYITNYKNHPTEDKSRF